MYRPCIAVSDVSGVYRCIPMYTDTSQMYTDVSLYRMTGVAGQGERDVSGVYSTSIVKPGVKKSMKPVP